jgi:general secretion pathway protein G
MNSASRSVRMTGFTLIELVVTLALVGVLAMTSMPLYEVVSTRMKESELRSALRTIRSALDAYKARVDDGSIERQPGQSGYPPTLAVLVEGVEVHVQRLGGAGSSTPEVKRLVFLRQLPRDPFHPDMTTPADQTWNTRAYGSPPDAPFPGDDVFDVSSRSDRTALDGRPYSTW